MRILATPYSSLVGKRVRVYRNLHNGLFSVQHQGKVIGHFEAVYLEGVTFTVQPAGRAKVLATKQKQVHAYVNGTLTEPAAPAGTIGADRQRVSYNPYRAGHFATFDGQAVAVATRADVTASGVWVN